MVASGTFGYAQEASPLVDLNALGGIITKSITPKARAGNPPNRIVELPAGMLNSIGLANVGVENFIKEKLPFLRTLQTVVIVNVAGATETEFLTVIERLNDEEGIDGYELNYSCPNVEEGGLEFSQNEKVAARVTAAIRKATSRPLIVKLTPNVTKVGEVARAAEQNGADALSLINTLVGMSVDIESRRPKIPAATAGYSGPAIKPVALAKVYEAVQSVGIPVIGIGGIMNGQDALEFLITGARAIQVGTANFINPAVGLHIVKELLDYCKRCHLSAISEVIGSLKVGDAE